MTLIRLFQLTQCIKHTNLQNHQIRLSSKAKVTKIRPSITNKINLPPSPLYFKVICILTTVSITCGSLYCLRENLLFGTLAGISAKSCTAPLERLTTHRQASIDRKYSIPSVLAAIYKEEGIFGFWRGNGLNSFRASIQKGSLFALNDFFKSLLTQNMIYSNMESQDINESAIMSFVCGSMAGLISTVITYPLDPIKTVNQATIHRQKWPAMTIWYSLVLTKGYVCGPWIAAVPTMVGTTVYYGSKFMAFDLIIKRIDSMSAKYDVAVATDLRNATAGLLAGVIGNSVIYPNNCVRKRMQTTHICEAIGIDSEYIAERYAQTAKKLFYEGGIPRFYRGFFINLCRNAPNTAIQFVVYKRLHRMWNNVED